MSKLLLELMLLTYVEHRLRYDQFTMCTVKIHFVLCVAMETARFYIAQISFFLRTFFSLFSWSKQTIWHP